jgi:predicted TPR repeat methyltransferase
MAKKIIEKYNDKLAGVYDKATSGEFRWTPPIELTKIIKPHLGKNLAVLDIGVGTGQTSKIFIKRGAAVTGIDISQKMLDVAFSKYKFERLIKHDLEKGLSHIDLKSKFDIIVAIGVLEFIKNPKKLLYDLKKLLKDEGIIVLTYELYEKNNTYGLGKTAPLGEIVGPDIPKLLRFKVYRKTPHEINFILKSLGLNTLARKFFTAYYKSEQKIPVPYEIILAKKA